MTIPQPRAKKYIPLENDFDFHWEWALEEKRAVVAGWRKGASVWALAEQLKRDPDELMLLLIDLSRRGKIKPRPGWVWGKSSE